MGVVLAYSGGWLDRAGGRRADPGWVAAALAAPDARLLPMWRDRCLVTGEPPVPLALPAATTVSAAADAVVFLGLDGGTSLFAADLSTMEEPAALALTGASGTADVRALVETVPPELAAALAYGRGLLHWHRGAGPLGYSTLAGFVEIGESLEDAVRRELAEEAGVRVRSLRYAASQAWPFPAGFLIRSWLDGAD